MTSHAPASHGEHVPACLAAARPRGTSAPALPLAPLVASLAALLAVTADANAASVRVSIQGQVAFNWMQSISGPPIGDVAAGESVTASFLIDTDVFVDGLDTHTRGYAIDAASYLLSFESGSLGLAQPYPAGLQPYLVLRDDATLGDGFFLSTDVAQANGVTLSQPGALQPFHDAFTLSCDATTLASLDVLQALGSVDPVGFTEAHWVLVDGPFEPLGIDFEQLTLTFESGWIDAGSALAGVSGPPLLLAQGDLAPGCANQLVLLDAAPDASAALLLALQSTPAPFKGGTLVAFPVFAALLATTSPTGSIPLGFRTPVGLPPGTDIWAQWAIVDGAAPQGLALSNAARGLTP